VTFDKITRPAGGTAPSATNKRDAQALVVLMRQAAEAAAAVIRAAEPRRAALDWREKSPVDFVTEVDVTAEARVIEILSAAEPSAEFLAEESTPAALGPLPSALRFIVDPLDGTTNFLHGLPEYAVSIGAELDGVLSAGIVLHVPRNECFTAALGGGAWLGDTRIHVSNASVPQRALIGTGFPFKRPEDIPEYIAQIARVMAGTSGVRRAGSASVDLTSVACGRLDGFWETFLSPWDVAAGILLIREAGGICTDADGSDSQVSFGSIVAGNAVMHRWLLDQLGHV
jgi:myo-inositol-1(or 4)-monophosphatase